MLLWIALACTKAEPEIEPAAEAEAQPLLVPDAPPFDPDCKAMVGETCFGSTEAACASLSCQEGEVCIQTASLPPRALCGTVPELPPRMDEPEDDPFEPLPEPE